MGKRHEEELKEMGKRKEVKDEKVERPQFMQSLGKAQNKVVNIDCHNLKLEPEKI